MGAHHLFQNANYVDSLNVFPVQMEIQEQI